MRGADLKQERMFTYVAPESRIPTNQPLRLTHALLIYSWIGLMLLFSSAHGSSFTAADAFNRLPMRFEPNRGQWSSSAEYMARGEGYLVSVSAKNIAFRLPQSAQTGNEPWNLAKHEGNSKDESVNVTLDPIGAGSNGVVGEDRLASVSNYFQGSDRRTWRTDIANFRVVRNREIYRGIDWLIYGNPSQLEYDFVVAPHANPGRIALAVRGADRLTIDPSGDLLIEVGNRSFRQLKPKVFQVDAQGVQQPITASYRLRSNRLSFALGRYDHSRTLIIDPILEYSTYLGGSLGDYGQGIAVDSTGSVYVTGYTSSTDFPTVSAYQSKNGFSNAFVAKFNASGNALVYATYLGGSKGEEGRAIAVDSAGDAYVTGWTFSSDFPTTNAIEATNRGAQQAGFVSKLNAAGDELIFSTYLTGTGSLNAPSAIALDSMANAYVSGDTNSVDFPISAAFQSSNTGRLNAFLTKLNPSGTTLVYSTYIGGSGADSAYTVAVDAAGSAYIAGSTNSSDFPIKNAFQTVNSAALSNPTNLTGFVSKFSPTGNELLYSTYLGGSVSEEVHAIAVDASGNAYVAGETCSPDFPVVNAFQMTNRSSCNTGGPNAFVTKLNGTGNALIYSTYLGGSGGGNGIIGDYAYGIAVDTAGNAYVGGLTQSSDFPLSGALQSTEAGAAIGASNGFVAELSASGASLLFSTYIGGSGSHGNTSVTTGLPFGDAVSAVALDGSRNIYLAGHTGSADFPTVRPLQSTNNSQTSYGTISTAFVSKIATQAPAPPPSPADVVATTSGSQIVLTWNAVNGATSYNIYQGSAAGQESITPVATVYSTATATVSKLPTATINYFVVTAVNEDGESAKSSEASVGSPQGGKSGGGSFDWLMLSALTPLCTLRLGSKASGRVT